MKIKIKKLKTSSNHSSFYSLPIIVDLMDSMNSFGQSEPILIDFNFNIIAGHEQVKAAKMLEWTYIDAIHSRKRRNRR